MRPAREESRAWDSAAAGHALRRIAVAGAEGPNQPPPEGQEPRTDVGSTPVGRLTLKRRAGSA